jgi:hypothetical protein
MQFGPLTLKHCKYGWMLFCGPAIGKCFDLYGQYSESEVAMMRSLLKPGDTVVDVGANIGDLTIPLSRIVGDSGRVYAVESNPATFNVLCANLALNSILNTKPINAFIAASDNVETGGAWGEFAYIGKTWKPHFLAIDALNLEACDLIKVDVDGKELEVLRSAEMKIEKYRPVLYFENDLRENSSELLGFAMETLGYDLYWHPAPIFSEDNYFGNPVNHWAPRNFVSLMVLGVPSERRGLVGGLRQVRTKDDWWEELS